ncbi:MAG: MFS transporter [Candidatus Moranbacteria bacterium]|nr:MFS transporter [Candidatus Moranbacteria bacterium]
MSVKRNIKLLAWFNFFSDFRLYSAIMVIYFQTILESYALAMLVFSITMVSSSIFEIPTGIFSDFIGRKKTMVLGAFCSTISVILYALGGNFFFLAAGGIFEGLTRSFYSGNNTALLYDSLREMKKISLFDEMMGKTSAMFQLALAISAILGSLIAGYSLNLAIWISVIPQFISFIISFFITDPYLYLKKSSNVFMHLKEAFRNFLKNKKLRLLSIISMFSFAVGESLFQFQAAFYKTLWPIWALGIPKILSFGFGFLSFWFSSRVFKKIGPIKALMTGTLGGGFINISAAFLSNAFSPILMSFSSFFYGTDQTAKSTLMQREFSQKQRATMDSLNTFLGSLFFGVISILIGYFADEFSPQSAIIIGEILLLPLLIIHFKLLRMEKRGLKIKQ